MRFLLTLFVEDTLYCPYFTLSIQALLSGSSSSLRGLQLVLVVFSGLEEAEGSEVMFYDRALWTLTVGFWRILLDPCSRV